MAKHETRYPELTPWWRERLFVRRTIGGEYFGIGRQEWYVSKIRGVYFGDDKPDPYVGVKFETPGLPAAEVIGFRRAKIRDGFGYIHIRDMREPMMALILSDAQPLPRAHDVARACGMSWRAFVAGFGDALYDMYRAGVALHGV